MAVWTIAARESFAAVVGFVAYGLLLALVWVRLAAPDVALTEARIGSGLTGGLLIAVASRPPAPARNVGAGETPALALRSQLPSSALLVSAGLAAIVLLLPMPAPTLAPEAAANIALTGLENPVTAVLMAYRAIDTLLEVVVLLLALLGVWSLAPDRFWGGRAGIAPARGAGRHSVFFGRSAAAPGRGSRRHSFVLGWLGCSLAANFRVQRPRRDVDFGIDGGLVDAPPVDRRWLRLLLVIGPAVFLAIGLAGFAMVGTFLAYPPDHAKLLIVAIELPVTLSITAILVLLVAGPPQRELRG